GAHRHHRQLLGHAVAPGGALDARGPVVFVEGAIELKAFAQLDAAVHGSVDEELVEGAPARRRPPRDPIGGEVAGDQREVTEVRELRGRGWSGLRQALQQSPALQAARPMAMDKVPMREVARELRAVYEQDLQPSTGQ